MSTIKVDTIATRTGSGNITLSNSLASATVAGDLTVDGNTLHVDSSNNKVGLGVDPGTMPSFITHAVSVINGGGIGITSPSSGDNRLIFFGTGTSSSDVQLAAIKNTTSDIMFLGAAGAEKARVLNSGGITFNGDTATANALNDYEEGTWTPTLVSTGASFQYSVQSGIYTKIGDLVTFNCVIQLDGGGNSFSGNSVALNGWPFATRNSQGAAGRFFISGRYLNLDLGNGYTYAYADLAGNSSSAPLKESGDNVPTANLTSNDLSSSSGQLYLHGHYYTDS